MRRATQCLTQKARFEHARYSLKEPKREVQELYVKNMKQSIARDHGLVRKLTRAFASCQKELADKLKPRTLPHAVASIAARRVLNMVLKRRREGAGEFLKCVRKLQVLHLLTEDGVCSAVPHSVFRAILLRPKLRSGQAYNPHPCRRQW